DGAGAALDVGRKFSRLLHAVHMVGAGGLIARAHRTDAARVERGDAHLLADGRQDAREQVEAARQVVAVVVLVCASIFACRKDVAGSVGGPGAVHTSLHAVFAGADVFGARRAVVAGAGGAVGAAGVAGGIGGARGVGAVGGAVAVVVDAVG